MIETGTIKKIDKRNVATVRFARKSACENCHMCFKPRNEMFVELTVKNTLNAKVGDRVSISMGKDVVLISSFIVYILPIIFVGIVLVTTKNMDEMISFGIAGIVLLLSYVIISIADKWIKKKKNFIPKMVKIIMEDSRNGK